MPNFSAIAKPITRLLGKDVPVVGGEEESKAFDTIRNEMCTEGRALKRMDLDLPLLLYCDWSASGIGAVLGQVGPDGKEYMVACISRSLNIHERNCASYKGEMLGMVWSVKTLRPWLHGTHFNVVTDHRPLLWLMRTKELTRQYAKWSLALHEYDFEVAHRAGLLHINADVLS